VSERLKEPASKAGSLAKPGSWVQIPPSPPFFLAAITYLHGVNAAVISRVPKDFFEIGRTSKSGAAEQIIGPRGMPQLDFASELTDTESLDNTMILAI
jgi:hypothetical protein